MKILAGRQLEFSFKIFLSAKVMQIKLECSSRFSTPTISWIYAFTRSEKGCLQRRLYSNIM